MDSILYSLIIPHYNNPGGVKRLLSTLPTREDLEIIVVDDCSNHMALEPLSKYCTEFQNVELVSTGSNGGGGKARNVGLQLAKGKFVFFADADDFFLPSLNKILDRYIDSSADIIFFNAISLAEETFEIRNRANHLQRFIKLAEKDPKGAELQLRFLFGEPWCKLVNRDLIVRYDIKFEEIRLHNDTLFSYMTGFHADRCEIDSTVAYVVTDSDNSISKIIDWDKIALRTEVFARKNSFLKSQGIALFDSLLNSSFNRCIDQHNEEQLKRNLDIAVKNGIDIATLQKIIKRKKREMLKTKLRPFLFPWR